MLGESVHGIGETVGAPELVVDDEPPELAGELSIAAHTEDQRPLATRTTMRIPRHAKMTPPRRTFYPAIRLTNAR